SVPRARYRRRRRVIEPTLPLPRHRQTGLRQSRALGRLARRAQKRGPPPPPARRNPESHRHPPRRPPAGPGDSRQRGQRPPGPPPRSPRGVSPRQRISHAPLVPPRIPKVSEQSPRHLGVRRETVLDETPLARVYFVGRVTRFEVGLAADGLRHVDSRRGVGAP